jgi:hypothetical protein
VLILVRAFSAVGLATLLVSLKLYFPAAVELLRKEPSGGDIAGLDYVRAYATGNFLPWSTVLLTWLCAMLALEVMFRLPRLSRDTKTAVMTVALAAFYMLPIHIASGFGLMVAWLSWAPQVLFLTIISAALYGQHIFPLGPQEIGQLRTGRDVLNDEARVMAVTGTMQYEHGIAQTATGIAIALGITAGMGALGGISVVFRTPAPLLAFVQYYGPSLLWSYVGFMIYLMLQMRKSSLYSEYLRQIISGRADLPFAGTRPDGSFRPRARSRFHGRDDITPKGDLTTEIERDSTAPSTLDSVESMHMPRDRPGASDQ